MLRTLMCCLPLLLVSTLAAADEAGKDEAAAQQDKPAQPVNTGKRQNGHKSEPNDGDEAKVVSGMSILGNDEAPKSLVIVPWKTSRIGDAPGLSRLLDDSTQPVDKEVFMRELAYYEIKSE